MGLVSPIREPVPLGDAAARSRDRRAAKAAVASRVRLAAGRRQTAARRLHRDGADVVTESEPLGPILEALDADRKARRAEQADARLQAQRQRAAERLGRVEHTPDAMAALPSAEDLRRTHDEAAAAADAAAVHGHDLHGPPH